MSAFSERLREMLDERGIAIDMLARQTGISNGTIREWLNRGRGNPQAANLVTIAQTLDISSDYLCGLSDVKTPLSEIKRAVELLPKREMTKLARRVKTDYSAFVCEKCLYELPMGVYPAMVRYCLGCGRRVSNGAKW